MAKKKKYKKVYIQWADAVSNATWFTESEALKWGENCNFICEELGWLLEENDEYILLASRCMTVDDGMEPTYGLLQKIPKAWVIKKRIIKL